MVFYIIGGLCLIGFFKTLRGGRHRQRRWRGGPRYRRGMDYIFNRLDTSPGQEKEIRSAVETFLDDAMTTRRELRRSLKEELTQVLSEEELDEEGLRERLGEQELRITGLRESLVAMVARVHAALDSEQRERLRSFLSRTRRMPMAGPYR